MKKDYQKEFETLAKEHKELQNKFKEIVENNYELSVMNERLGDENIKLTKMIKEDEQQNKADKHLILFFQNTLNIAHPENR